MYEGRGGVGLCAQRVESTWGTERRGLEQARWDFHLCRGRAIKFREVCIKKTRCERWDAKMEMGCDEEQGLKGHQHVSGEGEMLRWGEVCEGGGRST